MFHASARRHVPEFQRDAFGAGRFAQFGFRAVQALAGNRRPQEGRETGLASQFQALAHFAVRQVAFRLGAGLALILFRRDGGFRGPKLALQVRDALFQRIEFGAGFVRQALRHRQFGHALAVFGLALAKLAKALLRFCHFVFLEEIDIARTLADFRPAVNENLH